MTKYTFSVSREGSEIISIITQTSSGRTKTFRQSYGCVENMTNHMASLTDVQCDDWFKQMKK